MSGVNLFYFLLTIIIASCNASAGEDQKLQKNQNTTQNNLPPPYQTKSAVKFSKVIGWSSDEIPVAPEGFIVSRFASGLKSPRNIYVLENGDVLIAQANTESKGASKVVDAVTRRVKSQHTQGSPDQVTLFRDTNKDGTYEFSEVFVEGIKQPFGMVLIGNHFYVAATDAVYKYEYKKGDTKLSSSPVKITDLPAGGYNNHWTRNLITNRDESKIYIAVGSGTDHAEKGMDVEIRRANILEINPDGTEERIYASGLRNPVGMDWYPGTNTLWTAVNERDKLGDHLVPDYLTSVKEGGFYGWPYSYFGQHPDPRIKEKDQKPELIKKAIVPDVPLGSHTASLGLAFYDAQQFPVKYHNGAFIAQHGSWNSSVLVGYKVVFVPFRNGNPAGPPEDFLTGFLVNKKGREVHGRPVGLAILPDGSLLVSDDGAGVIWRVSYKKKK